MDPIDQLEMVASDIHTIDATGYMDVYYGSELDDLTELLREISKLTRDQSWLQRLKAHPKNARYWRALRRFMFVDPLSKETVFHNYRMAGISRAFIDEILTLPSGR